MSRQPYISKQPSNWYLRNRFFKRYMLRELTCVPVALAVLNLFYALAALAGSARMWADWVNLQTHPLLVCLNLFAIVAAVFNTKTWFEAMPKAMPKIKPLQCGRFVVSPALILIGASWLVFILVFVMLLAALLWVGKGVSG